MALDIGENIAKRQGPLRRSGHHTQEFQADRCLERLDGGTGSIEDEERARVEQRRCRPLRGKRLHRHDRVRGAEDPARPICLDARVEAACREELRDARRDLLRRKPQVELPGYARYSVKAISWRIALSVGMVRTIGHCAISGSASKYICVISRCTHPVPDIE